MHERHEEYMKRRMREEEIPAKFHNVKKSLSLLIEVKPYTNVILVVQIALKLRIGSIAL